MKYWFCNIETFKLFINNFMPLNFSESIFDTLTNFLLFPDISTSLAMFKTLISCALRNMSKSLSKVCFISTAIIESIPNSARDAVGLTLFKSFISVVLDIKEKFF